MVETAIDAFNYVISWLAVIGLFFVFMLIGLVIFLPLRTAWRERRGYSSTDSADHDGQPRLNDAELQ